MPQSVFEKRKQKSRKPDIHAKMTSLLNKVRRSTQDIESAAEKFPDRNRKNSFISEDS